MATPTSGQVGTFNRTVGVKVNMEDMVPLLTPDDTPILQTIPWGTTVQTKVEWMDEQLLAQTFAIDAAGVSGTGPWTLTGTGEAVKIRSGDVLGVQDSTDDTLAWVVDSVTDDDTIVVSGFAGNTTGPTAETTLVIIGQYRNEGSDPEDPRSIGRDQFYNYTQITQEQVEASRTARKRGAGSGMYGQGDPYDHEVMKKFRELGIRLEKQFLHGRRVESGDKRKRAMGGLFYFITTTTTSGVKANIASLVQSAIQKSYEVGGNSQSLVLMVSPAVKTILSSVEDSRRRTTRTETTAGSVIDRYDSDFGSVRIVTNRHLPRTRGLVLDLEYVQGVNFDPLFHELLAKTGDADKGHIVCEKSLKVMAERVHGTFTVTDA